MAVLFLCAQALTISRQASAQPAGTTAIVALVVNGRTVDDSLLVLRRDGVTFVQRVVLQAARLIVDPRARTQSGPGGDLVAVEDMAGLTVRFDAAQQALVVDAPPSAFLAARLETAAEPLSACASASCPNSSTCCVPWRPSCRSRSGRKRC